MALYFVSPASPELASSNGRNLFVCDAATGPDAVTAAVAAIAASPAPGGHDAVKVALWTATLASDVAPKWLDGGPLNSLRGL